MSESLTPDPNKEAVQAAYEDILSAEGMPAELPQDAVFAVEPAGLMHDVADDSPAPDERVIEHDLQTYVRGLMETHNTARQRQVISELYETETTPSRKEVADRIGISETRVVGLKQRGMNTVSEAARATNGIAYLKEVDPPTPTPDSNSADDEMSKQRALRMEKNLLKQSEQPGFSDLLASYNSYGRNDISPHDMYRIKRQQEQLFGVQSNWSQSSKRIYMNDVIAGLHSRLDTAKRSAAGLQHRSAHIPEQHQASLERAEKLINLLSASLVTAKALHTDYLERLRIKHRSYNSRRAS